MQNGQLIDINEKKLYKKYPKILELFLFDRTSKKNIIWATDSYKKKGYNFNDNINVDSILKYSFIKPRSKKSKTEQNKRAKDNAEVFTPSWVCNKQNNLIDNAWFGYENVFNFETENSWKTNYEKIKFINDKTWIDYINDIRLEISCGEAPYLVSRYDTVTGDYIQVKDRIGLLDRKFRVLNENCEEKEEWIKLSLKALKSIYGYEWQGDNLILARENLFMSYIDYYQNKFNEFLSEDLLTQVAEIISFNIWQMDGIKCVIPNSCKSSKKIIYDLFGEEHVLESGCSGCSKGTHINHNGMYSKIKDWEKDKMITYVSLLKGALKDE